MDTFERMSRALGLRPVVFGFFLLLDWLYFGGEAVTAFAVDITIIPLAVASAVMFVFAFAMQKADGDGLSTAFAKALVLAFLTAIPTGVFSVVVAIGAYLAKSNK